MELESYTNVILRQSLRELLSPHSPLWPEVKVFMSICKSAGQRLPPEVQVWNMMNVRKGLKRLLRLSPLYGSTDGVVDTSKSNKIELKAVRTSGAKCEDHDPVQVKLLLRWIVERIEIAAAYALQRLRIGHQVNWISALLASLARIRQFCIEILEKLEHKIVKHSATKQHFDEGVPLDRATFVQLKAGLSAKSQLKLSSANARSSETATDVKSQVNIPSSSTTIQSGKRQRSTAIKEQACGIAKTSDDARQQGSNAEKSDTCVTKEKQSKHPIIIELRSHIKQLMKGKSAMTKTALKKIYGIALKRSRFYAAGDDRSIRKLCKVALHKAQASELVDLQLPLGIWLYSKQTQENAGKREMGFFKVLKELATNPVLYVSVPGLIVMHYGWFKLQQNKDLVPSEQQFTEQPILIISRYIYMGLKTGTWDMEAARAAGRPKSSEGKCEK